MPRDHLRRPEPRHSAFTGHPLHTALTASISERPGGTEDEISVYLLSGGRSSLLVGADEWGRSGRMVALAVDQHVAVEGHPTGRGRFTPLRGAGIDPEALIRRRSDTCLQLSEARPGRVEGHLVSSTEIVPGDSRSGSRHALEVLGARDG